MPQTKQRANYLLRCSDGYADVVPGITMQLEQREIEKMADIPRRIFEHEKAKEK